MPPERRDQDDRDRRLARNEDFHREANEMIEREARGWHERTFDCICECSRRGCMKRLKVTTVEYEGVRAAGDHFLVAPGHEDTEIEEVIESHDEYLVVQKTGAADEVALETDPR